MPGLLVAFWILIGFGSARALTDPTAPIYRGVDGTSNRRVEIHAETTEYRVWTAVPWYAAAGEDGKCHVTMFATTTGGRRTRLRIAGIEQNVDWSWTYEATIKVDFKQRVRFTFMDPVSRAVLSDQWTEVSCIHDRSPVRDQNLYTDRGLRGYDAPPPCPECPKLKCPKCVCQGGKTE